MVRIAQLFYRFLDRYEALISAPPPALPPFSGKGGIKIFLHLFIPKGMRKKEFGEFIKKEFKTQR
jgi:hypothetical protein